MCRKARPKLSLDRRSHNEDLAGRIDCCGYAARLIRCFWLGSSARRVRGCRVSWSIWWRGCEDAERCRSGSYPDRRHRVPSTNCIRRHVLSAASIWISSPGGVSDWRRRWCGGRRWCGSRRRGRCRRSERLSPAATSVLRAAASRRGAVASVGRRTPEPLFRRASLPEWQRRPRQLVGFGGGEARRDVRNSLHEGGSTRVKTADLIDHVASEADVEKNAAKKAVDAVFCRA